MSLGSARLWNRRKAGVSYKLLFLRPLMLLLFKAFWCFLKAGQRKILARDMRAYLHSDSCSIKSCDFFHGKVAGGPFSWHIQMSLMSREDWTSERGFEKVMCGNRYTNILVAFFMIPRFIMTTEGNNNKKNLFLHSLIFLFASPVTHCPLFVSLHSFFLLSIGLMVNSRNSLNSVINKSCSQAQQWTKKRFIIFLNESRKCFGWTWSCKWAASAAIRVS